MRLQKFMAAAGVASRRASETLIFEGRVTEYQKASALALVSDDEL